MRRRECTRTDLLCGNKIETIWAVQSHLPGAVPLEGEGELGSPAARSNQNWKISDLEYRLCFDQSKTE